MILVTGATGNLGAHLVFELLKKYGKVVAIKRKNSSLSFIEKVFSDKDLFKRIEWRIADLEDYYSIYQALEGVDTVYHCAAYVSLHNRNYNKFFDTNYHGTSNLVNASLERKVKRFCHTSSIATIGVAENGLATEKNFLNTEEIKSYYSLSKFYGEMEVWRAIEEGLNAVIVNPAVILAPYPVSGISKFLLRYLLKKGIKYYTLGQKSYIDVRDLAKIMIKLTESGIKAERFIIRSENLSFKDLVEYFNYSIDKKVKIKELNLLKLNLMRFLLNVFTLGNSPLTKNYIHYLTTDDIYSNEKIKSALNFDFTPVRTTIADFIGIMKKNV